jgi:hypothetical protein
MCLVLIPLTLSFAENFLILMHFSLLIISFIEKFV